MPVDLRPHQIQAIKELENGTILRGGVGTGKSLTALVYFYTRVARGRLRLNGAGNREIMAEPLDLYIITTARKRDHKDWEKDIAALGLGRDPESNFSGISVVVDSWNNIDKYRDVKDAMFILDEQRLVGSGAWVKSFLQIAKHNKWIMLSATPGDNWMDYIPVFIANGFYKNRTEFIRRHVVYRPFTKFPQVQRYVETDHLEKLRGSITVEMPYLRHTKRHIRNVTVGHDVDLYKRVAEDLWHVYEERPLRDAGEKFAVLRKVVNSDVDRLRAIMQLLEKHPRLIVFYNFDYELEMLRTLHAVLGITCAEWNGHKHQPVPGSERWLYLVQYSAGAEAWNCIDTDAIAFYSMTYSYRQFEQSQGRIDRMNTPFTDLWYYVLRSNSSIDNGIRRALAAKQDFNERDLEV